MFLISPSSVAKLKDWTLLLMANAYRLSISMFGPTIYTTDATAIKMLQRTHEGKKEE